MIVEIKSEKAKVLCLKEGAMLHSLKKDNIEYLWQGDSEHWAGQAPVCFPIVGVLPNGKINAFDRECEMKRHGVARINPFEIKESGKNYVVFSQDACEDSLKAFPFNYHLEIKYTVVDSTVTTEYTIKNNDSINMPFVIGGHPAFNCPLTNEETFEDYKVSFDKKMTKKVLRPNHETGLVNVEERFDALNDSNEINLVHDLFEENDAMVFDNVESKCAVLMGPKGKGVKIEYQDMNNILVWSACNKANFVALEPWSGISHCSDEDNQMEHKRGMTILAPGEEASLKFKITLI